MFQDFLGRLPGGLIFFCAFLSVAVPFIIAKVNSKLVKYGNPPWKKQN